MGGFLNEANVEVVIHRALGRTGSQMVSAAKKNAKCRDGEGGDWLRSHRSGLLGVASPDANHIFRAQTEFGPDSLSDLPPLSGALL